MIFASLRLSSTAGLYRDVRQRNRRRRRDRNTCLCTRGQTADQIQYGIHQRFGIKTANNARSRPVINSPALKEMRGFAPGFSA